MKLIFYILFLYILPAQKPLTVAVSANMKYTFDSLKVVFEKDHHIPLTAVVGASGTLTTQIRNGAPYDLFLSADMDYPNALYKDSLTIGKPIVYAYGTLIIWSTKNTYSSISQMNDSKTVAIANPKIAPYGKEADKVLRKYNYSSKGSIVFGQNIGQVNTYIITHSVDAGITSKSVVKTPEYKSVGSWIDVPENDYTPIEQGMVLLKRSDQMKDMIKFRSFITSKKAQDILHAFGYKQKGN